VGPGVVGKTVVRVVGRVVSVFELVLLDERFVFVKLLVVEERVTVDEKVGGIGVGR
jgi:hypothetical protein